MKSYLALARFDNWTKNVFVFIGLFLAYFLVGEKTALHIPSILCSFFAVCFASSANYIINEFLDARFDMHHPVKKNRSAVKNTLTASKVYLLYVVFALISLALAYVVNSSLLIVTAIFLISGLAYNIRPVRTKDIAYLDVISESFNYPLRILAGWVAVLPTVMPPSSLCLAFWFAGAFAMTVKRVTEINIFPSREDAMRYRRSYKNYSFNSLVAAALAYAMLTAFFIGVFLIKYKVEFVILFPLICIWFALYIKMGLSGSVEAIFPEKLYKKNGLLFLAVIMVVLFFMLLEVNITPMKDLNEPVDFGTASSAN